jgi:hypothetical protein
LKGNQIIKSLPSMFYFLKIFHTARMDLHTDRMPYFSAVNDCCGRAGSDDAPVGMKTRVLALII